MFSDRGTTGGGRDHSRPLIRLAICNELSRAATRTRRPATDVCLSAVGSNSVWRPPLAPRTLVTAQATRVAMTPSANAAGCRCRKIVQQRRCHNWSTTLTHVRLLAAPLAPRPRRNGEVCSLQVYPNLG